MFIIVLYPNTLTYFSIIILHIADCFYTFALTNKTLITNKTNNIMNKIVYIEAYSDGCQSPCRIKAFSSLVNATTFILDCLSDGLYVKSMEVES